MAYTLGVDIREKRERIHGVEAIFKDDEDWTVKVDEYEVGDYLVGNTLGVECKTPNDFHASIKDGRLFQQAEELKQNFANPIILVPLENGHFDELLYPRYGGVNPESIRGAIASLFARREVPVHFAEEDVPRTVERLVRKAMKGEDVEYVPVRKRVEVDDLQKHLLLGLPNVGPERAEAILEAYRSPLHALKDVQRWPHRVEGIGDKTRDDVKDVLDPTE